MRKCKACFDLSDVSFSQVSETKLHEVDEKLDEIEQILSLYEAKLESVPEEYFENLPEVPMAEVEENVVARTENPLMVEQQARTVAVAAAGGRGKTEKGRKTMMKSTAKGKASTAAKGGAAAKNDDTKKSYVPPPPKDGAKISQPAGVPKVKTFPISSGPCPPMMSIPGIETASKETPAANGEGGPEGGGGAAAAEEPIDDGFTPEQRRKMELESDPGFKTYLMMKRMRMPLINIRIKIKTENKGYAESDMNVSITTHLT